MNTPKTKLVQIVEAPTPTEKDTVDTARQQLQQNCNFSQIDRKKYNEAVFIQGKVFYRNPTTGDIIPGLSAQMAERQPI